MVLGFVAGMFFGAALFGIGFLIGWELYPFIDDNTKQSDPLLDVMQDLQDRLTVLEQQHDKPAWNSKSGDPLMIEDPRFGVKSP